jgi:hypothetical protein
VVLPKSGYVYLKSDKASLGYFIWKCNPQICEMLKMTTLSESRVVCAQSCSMVMLTIDAINGSFLMVMQYDSIGKNMWAALVKLQRWFRWVRYAIPRCTAVAMCLHERLGKDSKLGNIGADIIQLVAWESRKFLRECHQKPHYC